MVRTCSGDMRATCSCAIFIISGVMPGNPAIVASEEATWRLAMWPLLALRPTMSERHVIAVSEHSRALCLVMQAAGLLGRLTLLRAGRAGRASRHVSACCRPSGVRASLLAGTGAEVPAVREVLCRRSVGAGRAGLSARARTRTATPRRRVLLVLVVGILCAVEALGWLGRALATCTRALTRRHHRFSAPCSSPRRRRARARRRHRLVAHSARR